MKQDMSPEERQIKAAEARQFMANPLFREMFEAIEGYLEQKALSCDIDNKDHAQRVVLSKQILYAMKREIERKAEDGDFAAFEIAQLEKQSVIKKFLRR